MTYRLRASSFDPAKVLVIPLIATVLLFAFTACGSLALNARSGDASASDGNSTSDGPGDALWVANGTNVLEFYPYAGGNMTMPILVLNSNAFAAPQGVVFDSANNLWVIDGGGDGADPALYQFTAAQLTSALTVSSLSPNVTIKSPSFVFPQQAAFDKQGNLWVSDNGADVVLAFANSLLTTSSTSLKPSATLVSYPQFAGPLGLAFDGNGTLWVANNASTTIYGFTPYRLPTLAPVGHTTVASPVVLADQNGTIRAPWGLAFDTSGKLWWSNSDPNSAYTVVAFGADLLQASGNPAATVTLSSTMVQGQTTLSAPNGIAFDTAGDLAAVSSLAPNGIAYYSAMETMTGGAKTPSIYVSGDNSTVNMAAGCSYGPWIH